MGKAPADDGSQVAAHAAILSSTSQPTGQPTNFALGVTDFQSWSYTFSTAKLLGVDAE